MDTKTPGDRPDLERLWVRLAIAATSFATTHSSVTPETLIALREGRLANAERVRVLAMLDTCPDCYDDWLALNLALAEEQGSQQTGRMRWPFWASIALGAVASLVLALWLGTSRFSPAIGAQVAATYQEASDLGLLPSRSWLKLESGAPDRYAFQTPTVSSSAERALASGIWAGRRLTEGDAVAIFPPAFVPKGLDRSPITPDPWGRSDVADYSALGRWLVLVVRVCETREHVPPRYWLEQQVLAERFLRLFEARAANDEMARPILRRLAAIQESIAQLADDKSRVRTCAELTDQARAIVAQATGGARPGAVIRPTGKTVSFASADASHLVTPAPSLWQHRRRRPRVGDI